MPRLTPPPQREPTPPRVVLPAGSVDSHLHMFGPLDRYPFALDANYVSEDATAEMYFELQDKLGLARAVLVSGGAYGQTYGHLVDMLKAHPKRLRGVVRLPPEVDWDEIVELDRVGVRAARFFGPGRAEAMTDAVLEMVKAIGWHVQFYPDHDSLAQMTDRLLALKHTVVLDHFAHNAAQGGLTSVNNRKLFKMLESGRVWVKLSAPMRVSQFDHPHADVTPIARELVARAPERMLWGSDWPHTLMWDKPMADDGLLVDLLGDWIDDAATLRAVMVTNPEKLYGFPAVTA